MNVERSIFEEVDEEAEAASIARARAQIAAGKGIPHEEVVKWLKTWGTPEEGPPPAEWFE
jgi:predicted transcriptional regulator